jgi:hypothetical protein
MRKSGTANEKYLISASLKYILFTLPENYRLICLHGWQPLGFHHHMEQISHASFDNHSSGPVLAKVGQGAEILEACLYYYYQRCYMINKRALWLM